MNRLNKKHFILEKKRLSFQVTTEGLIAVDPLEESFTNQMISSKLLSFFVFLPYANLTVSNNHQTKNAPIGASNAL
jgi:hypothetical protein